MLDKAVVLQQLELDLLIASVSKLDPSVAMAVSNIPQNHTAITNYIKLVSPELLDVSQKYASIGIQTIQKEAPDILNQVNQEQVGNVLKHLTSISPGILDKAFKVASSEVTYAVTDLLSSGALQSSLALIGEVGILAIAEIASGFPFLGPLKGIMAGITETMKDHALSSRQLKKLEQNCNEVYSMLACFGATLQPMIEKRPSLLKPLISALEDCHQLIQSVKQKGGFMKWLSAKETVKQISEYDNNVSRAMQTLQTHMQLTMMTESRISERIDSSAEFDEVKAMLKDLSKQREAGVNLNPEALAKLAEMTNEPYENIMSAVGNLSADLAMFAARNDSMQQKILDQSIRTNYQMDSSRAFAGEQLNSHDEQIQALRRQQDRQTAMVFSDVKQNAYLAARSKEGFNNGEPFMIVHCKGIGLDTLDNRDGFHGVDGEPGISLPPAASGMNGGPGLYGGHAMRGSGGTRGTDATHGSNGKEAENFEVHVKKESVLGDDVIYLIKIVYMYSINEERIQVNKKSRIFINGKGGDGGRGGHGGNGGHGQDGGHGGRGGDGYQDNNGGNGGDGGDGGDGGSGGAGGAGGDGGRGANVEVFVDDPKLLVLIEVNVAGGLGGIGGRYGNPGNGGNRGSAGDGGAGGSWQEAIRTRDAEGHYHTKYVTKYWSPGQTGRAGNPGRNGPPSQGIAATDGRHGKPGKVSFAVTDSKGNMYESGGIPYRLAFNPSELAALLPTPFNYGMVSKKGDPFVFGQGLHFGPTSPVNVGDMNSPSCQILVEYLLQCPSKSFVSKQMDFPAVPKSSGRQYGSIDINHRQEVKFLIPTFALSQLSFTKAWPHDSDSLTWSEPVCREAFVNASFTVEGMKFIATPSDTEFSSKRYVVKVDIPVKIIPNAGGAALLFPSSLSINEGEVEEVSFILMNTLGETDVPSVSTFKLRAACLGISPQLKCTTADLNKLATEVESTKDEIFNFTTVSGPIPPLPAKGCLKSTFDLSLPIIPSTDNAGLIGHNQFGKFIQLRNEMFFETEAAQHGDTANVRIAPPRPPVENVKSNDILIICNKEMRHEDFMTTLASLEIMCDGDVYFLDVDHFTTTALKTTGKYSLNAELWAAQKGKAVIVWIPTDSVLTDMTKSAFLNTLHSQFEEHLSLGGKLVTVPRTTFSANVVAAKNLYPQPARHWIVATNELAIQNMPPSMGGSVLGLSPEVLFISILCSHSINDKLEMLRSYRDVAQTLIGETNLDVYHRRLKVGCGGLFSCFGSKHKIAPEFTSRCCFQDCLLAAIRTDISMDMVAYASGCEFESCVAISALLRFETDVWKLISDNTAKVEIAREIVAVIDASSALTSNPGISKARRLEWQVSVMPLSEMREKFQDCVYLANSDDTLCLSERIKDIDVVAGFSCRQKGWFSGKDSINLSRGTAHGTIFADELKKSSKKK